MKYGVWFLRILFAAWMIPAGLNHFVPIFPQPMGNQPLSMELIHALIDSHLFDLVKAVELLAGIFVLFGIHTPLALLVCLPVSFGVFYWDAPLEGWGSIAARFGYATLLTNVLLCLAYHKSYQGMFAMKAEVSSPDKAQRAMIARYILGAGLLLFSAYILFMAGAPEAQHPLAAQLMTSLENSRLLHVALAVQLVAGVLLLAGIFVPLALTAQMAISSNALFWALFLNQSVGLGVLTLFLFAVNAHLMIAYLPSYKGVLAVKSLAAGETEGNSYDELFTSYLGSTSRQLYSPAIITALAAMGFFGYFVAGRTADFCMLVIVYPLYTVLTRRVRDMGQSPWLLFAPLMLVVLAFDVKLDYFSMGELLDGMIDWLAIVATLTFVIWAGVSDGKNSNQ